MNSIMARRIIDACHEAHQVEEILPELPEGMTPQYVRILDVIHELGGAQDELGGVEVAHSGVQDAPGGAQDAPDGIKTSQGGVRVSDISARMGLALPGITRSIGAMERLGAVEKRSSDTDRRVVLVCLTDKGRQWYQRYVGDFYRHMADILRDVPEEDVRTMIDVIHRVYGAMYSDLKGGKETDGRTD
jgi:DNA-binding MarR family transcriptional regulator